MWIAVHLKDLCRLAARGKYLRPVDAEVLTAQAGKLDASAASVVNGNEAKAAITSNLDMMGSPHAQLRMTKRRQSCCECVRKDRAYQEIESKRKTKERHCRSRCSRRTGPFWGRRLHPAFHGLSWGNHVMIAILICYVSYSHWFEYRDHQHG